MTRSRQACRRYPRRIRVGRGPDSIGPTRWVSGPLNRPSSLNHRDWRARPGLSRDASRCACCSVIQISPGHPSQPPKPVVCVSAGSESIVRVSRPSESATIGVSRPSQPSESAIGFRCPGLVRVSGHQSQSFESGLAGSRGCSGRGAPKDGDPGGVAGR